MIRDFTDDEARRALVLKWGTVERDVIPAWVAEMDYALAPPVAQALSEAVARGVTGYPPFEMGGELGRAYAGWARRQFGSEVDPELVIPTVDVTAGVRVALDVLSDPGPMVMPGPAYAPQLEVAQVTGRERVDLLLDPDAERAELDLDRLDRLFADGARTLLLTQPHNPWGRAFSRAELEGVRDVVVRHGARVISDEIHAPLVLEGAEHVSYLSIDGTADHAVAVVAASKAFNTAGLRCAQIVSADRATHERLVDVPLVRNDSWSPLGVIAAVAAYTDGDAWLDALRARLSAQRDLLRVLLAEQLPAARMRPLEATYLAWLDLRAYGHDDPAAVALERGRVRLAPGHDYQPGLGGHVRLNIATSPERLTLIVQRLAEALGEPAS
ncbi:MalY/PatB family protein [Nocardioides sp. cx-173]|uniref:MalY/PatB family protein n=1 Tax=Nocardioides sp. cx-173 TaxID=2898796 RepID=UPI001E5DE100|nr:aminotransferase class I/II-fold pyridoxal phosphate-dependent enzyme [Nocardioides sp. cx-173]MCD4523847.1 aminotransferase class I/II-fold pyridoxal phosphate-dependent enzyme [Nocardioides sp. cx-173]UGB41833.1 aminotransferase class I/II-fold pyridoxal phosphate-dependent enzyme [Nocardioides sp. cx-173]